MPPPPKTHAIQREGNSALRSLRRRLSSTTWLRLLGDTAMPRFVVQQHFRAEDDWHFDCASVYGNEHLIGHSLRTLLKSGLYRDEIWVGRRVP